MKRKAQGFQSTNEWLESISRREKAGESSRVNKDDLFNSADSFQQ